MKKLTLIITLTLAMSCINLLRGQNAQELKVTFRFDPGDDRFFKTLYDNESELDKFYNFIERHHDAIRSGAAPVHITSYSSDMETRAENLKMADIRSRRVKSMGIIKKDLINSDYRTTLHAQNLNGITVPAVVVKITVPATYSSRNAGMSPREHATQHHESHQPKICPGCGREICPVCGLEMQKTSGLAKEEQSDKPLPEVYIAPEETAYPAPPVPEPQEIYYQESTPAPVEREVITYVPYEYTPAPVSQWREPYHLALRTNLLYWAALMPNIGIEWRVTKGFGIKVDGGYSNWTLENPDRRHNIFYIHPEVRWYMGRAKRFYVGAGANYARTIVKWDIVNNILGTNKGVGYDGSFWSAGVVVGYQANLSRRMAMDFNVGFGYYDFKYDTFTMTGGNRVTGQRGRSKTMWAPTQAEIALVWRFGLDRD